jgi:hypothetical protein
MQKDGASHLFIGPSGSFRASGEGYWQGKVKRRSGAEVGTGMRQVLDGFLCFYIISSFRKIN